MNVVTLRPPKPPKPKFQKTIAGWVVTVEADNTGLVEIDDTELANLTGQEARALARALVKAADKADAVFAAWWKASETAHRRRGQDRPDGA